MNYKTDISAEQARAMLDYDPETGEFRWKYRTTEMFSANAPASHRATWNTKYAGKAAGSKDKLTGYIVIRVREVNYFAHRLAFLFVEGALPHKDVDHINGDRTDNRFVNLRKANRGENAQNRKKFSNNTSGYTGVSYASDTGKWCGNICAFGVKRYLGSFDTKEDAYAAYLKAKAELHQFQPTPRGDITDEQAA